MIETGSPAEADKPIRILQVDDSPSDRLIFRRYLSQHTEEKYVYTEAESIAEALQLIDREAFDCLLLDYDLPDGDGLELIRTINERFGKNSLPTVMLSGSGTIEVAIESMRAGAQDYLIKTRADPPDLVRAVNNAIEKVRLFRERRQANESLRRSEEKYRTLFNSIDEGFCIIEVLFDENERAHDYRFIEINHLFERQTGLENVVGKRIREILTETEEHWFEVYGKVALTGEPAHFENYSERFGRWYEISAFRAGDPEQRQVGVLFNDITPRKQAEQEREQLLEKEQAARADAEIANRLKDEFLAMLSHELRTPLNAMAGWAKLLRQGILDEQKRSKALEIIERNIRLQQSLIEDLLDVSRIMSGKVKIEPAPIDFCRTVSEAIETLKVSAEEKGLTVKNETATVPDCTINGDAFRLQQVIGNLLTNSIKFTPAHGTITVSLETIDDNAVLNISDTGIGIAPTLLPHVFDRFRQADGSTKRKFGGLGLGLAIAKSLVEMHGGTIMAASPGENQGSTFTITLPLFKKSRASNNGGFIQPWLREYTDGRNILDNTKIILVDDEPDSLDMVSYVLASHGAEIFAFKTAREALENVEKIDADLLISDISMAEMDGFDLIRNLRSLPSAKNKFLPAIAMTAYTSLDDRAAVLSAGFQWHLTKPIDTESLAAKVREVMERNR